MARAKVCSLASARCGLLQTDLGKSHLQGWVRRFPAWRVAALGELLWLGLQGAVVRQSSLGWCSRRCCLVCQDFDLPPGLMSSSQPL